MREFVELIYMPVFLISELFMNKYLNIIYLTGA